MEATTIEGGIIARLSADNDVAALVADRIHPMSDPRKISRPKLTYWRVDTVRNSAVGGMTNNGPTGMAVARVQFDAWADDLLSAKQIAGAVRRSLNGFAGTSAGIRIDAVYIDDERDNTAPLDPGTEKPVQRVTIDARVTYSETP